ncbi:protein TolA [Glaciecola punicea]|uniref:cell envelope integrity protein TolA n=1 Tax=Glaciecola punicea TaxID=56804 RepID=UPI000871D3B9|nr:cell envelope integrity protein TolA [Glaciecola punicea]OFA30943.1 protein TolA [Glaciecola punicea]
MSLNAMTKDAKVDNTEAGSMLSRYSSVKKVLRSPVFKSVALHGAILISLLVSFNFSAKPLKFVAPQASASALQPDIVKATFIDSNVIEQQKREIAQAEASAQKRQQDMQRQEAQRKEALRKKQVDETRKKQELQKIEQQDKLKREQEKERAIAQQLIKQEQEKAALEAQQKKRQEALDKALAKQLQEEQASMSQANQRRVLSEVEKYKALVHSKVQQFLETDGGFIGETCLVNVRLAPDGLVLRVEAVSGKPALCRIAKAAILRAGTLPMSKDPDVMAQFRQFDIEVSPER